MTEQDIFSKTLEGLEAGLHVRLVATFDLHCCAPADDLSGALDDPASRGFDQIPVKDGAPIVGVVERGAFATGAAGGTVGEQMRRLDDSLLISADAPLIRFVHLAAQSRYRLVVTETGITGIVTRSDLLKLPARVLVFTLVTHLETVMAEAILASNPADDSWRRLLSAGRGEGIEQKWRDYQKHRLDPPLLEFTDFCDKREIVKKAYRLSGRFEKELKAIEALRNTVAHAGNYAESEEAVRNLSHNLERAQWWIGELQRLVRELQGE